MGCSGWGGGGMSGWSRGEDGSEEEEGRGLGWGQGWSGWASSLCGVAVARGEASQI